MLSNSNQLFATVLRCALCAVLLAAFSHFAPPLQAQNKDKISKDLKVKLNGGGTVDIIVRSADVWTSTQTSAVTGSSGTVRASFVNFNLRSVRLPASAVNSLANRNDFAYFSLDRETKKLGHVSLTTGAEAAQQLTGAPGYNGTGVGIAILDSGVDPNHVMSHQTTGTVSRIVYSKDFTGENRTDDPYGHGTHVASLAAGSDNVSGGAYQGVVTNANIINLRVLNGLGIGTTTQLLTALDWVLTFRTNHNIRVVNLSLGAAALDSYRDDPLCLAVRRLVDAGVVVVAAAGNQGKDLDEDKIYGLIHAPGNDPSVITIGASNTYGTDARGDDDVTSYSSRGPTRSFWTDEFGVKHYDNLIKPDLVAPGNKLIDAQAPNNLLVSLYSNLDANVSGSATKEQMYLSGTSMAAPIVSGIVAQMLHANPTLKPNLVKALLMYTAQPLAGFNLFEQGAGQVNAVGAVQLAKLVRTDLKANATTNTALLTASPPPPQTTIAGHTFTWSQGLILDHTFATGIQLITNYQKVYGLGVVLGDGTMEGVTTQTLNNTMMSNGVVLGDNILTSSGVVLGDGGVFCSTSLLLNNGVTMNDGTILGDGTVLGDGTILGDATWLANFTTASVNAFVYGDNTPGMAVIPDGAVVSDAPSGLTTTAASASQINLAWTDNKTNETGFKIERSTDGVSFTQIATVGANVTAYASAGLTANTRYYYRVRAYTSTSQTAYSNTANTTTLRR